MKLSNVAALADRFKEREEVNKKIARGLFGWHPDARCDGSVDNDDYCEKCHQENLKDSFRDRDHPVEPLKVCASVNALLRLVEKLSEIKARVRMDSNEDAQNGQLAKSFRCKIKSPHTGVTARAQDDSPSEAVARCTADFLELEGAWIRAHVGLGDWLDEIHDLMSEVKALAEKEDSVPLYAFHGNNFIES
ncbi:MAG: hypothetical protein ACREP6_16380, partial [Candidatus Binataceae bacterium]